MDGILHERVFLFFPSSSFVLISDPFNFRGVPWTSPAQTGYAPTPALLSLQ